MELSAPNAQLTGSTATSSPRATPATEPKPGFGDVPMRDMLQRLHRDVPFAKALAVTTLPRGGLQVFAPAHADEALSRAFTRHGHAAEPTVWAAIRTGETVRSSDLSTPEALEKSVLKPHELGHRAACKLPEPLLPGYDGSLVLYREAGAEDFSTNEIKALDRFGRTLSEALDEAHPKDGADHGLPLAHGLAGGRVFAFDTSGNTLLGDVDALSQVSERLRHLVLETAKSVANREEQGDGVESERVMLADDLGDQWAFRVTRHAAYPALAEGPVVFVALQPEVPHWAALRGGHFPADDEIARLVPALKYMHDNYADGPSLGETAKTVYLSPFHFHRRFTEALGTTPKHFLFDCQIAATKAKLVAGEELAQIAKDCGFAHQSHFTSRFKQATGLTPTRWRKLARDRA
jgi:AraC-like DNA-binding protein